MAVDVQKIRALVVELDVKPSSRSVAVAVDKVRALVVELDVKPLLLLREKLARPIAVDDVRIGGAVVEVVVTVPSMLRVAVVVMPMLATLVLEDDVLGTAIPAG